MELFSRVPALRGSPEESFPDELVVTAMIGSLTGMVIFVFELMFWSGPFAELSLREVTELISDVLVDTSVSTLGSVASPPALPTSLAEGVDPGEQNKYFFINSIGVLCSIQEYFTYMTRLA